jgi:TetR/AcrR family transcriptional regulator, transcriptional repressor for nem operon
MKDARTRLLDAALKVVRERGYTATTVDELCRTAGVTKGAFFHHFKSKDELGAAAARHWSAVTGAMFAAATYHAPADPLDRLLAYIDFRKAMLAGELPDFTCFAGTTLQETYATHPDIRAACYASIAGHAGTLIADIEASIERYPPAFPVDARSLALHTQAVLQGSFILAKGGQDAALAAASVEHLRNYIELLFRPHSRNASPVKRVRKTGPQGRLEKRRVA